MFGYDHLYGMYVHISVQLLLGMLDIDFEAYYDVDADKCAMSLEGPPESFEKTIGSTG